MKKILVAIDGSENSTKALEKAKELALLNNSELMILNVVSDLRNYHPYVIDRVYESEINKVLLEHGKKLLDEALKIFEGYEGKVGTSIKCGDAAREIIEMAEKGGYDLVIMGSRGLNALSRAMLGSVSNKVLNHIKISVLIVR
ncbi:universal stress protein [Tissierella carlieri]|uniref:Universal stress protein n=1 Tax=Tissierella carlieri TaxID=689904 RepID=A0ABT1SAH6_9FIRM|nr:universal stress protein [Tissierella carlieri]MCQ4923483.1 universal stress protein [Tissierella carlieri]